MITSINKYNSSYISSPISSSKNTNKPDKIFEEKRKLCKEFLKEYNSYCYMPKSTLTMKNELLSKFLGSIGEDVSIKPNFTCEFGTNIYLKDRIYINENMVILDYEMVSIGHDCFFGPNCKIITSTLNPYNQKLKKTKNNIKNIPKPVKIGNDCFFGAGCIVLPGVTIGNNVIIGAGSVVTQNMNSGTIVCGNPARILKYF